jgi:hypothetical protein
VHNVTYISDSIQNNSNLNYIQSQTHLNHCAFRDYTKGGVQRRCWILLDADDWQTESCFQVRMYNVCLLETQSLANRNKNNCSQSNILNSKPIILTRCIQ